MNFNDPTLKNVADSVRDVLSQNNIIGKGLSPELEKAAADAGAAAREMGHIPVEGRNKVFTQHMIDASNGEILSTGQAGRFMDIAMNSYNNGENK